MKMLANLNVPVNTLTMAVAHACCLFLAHAALAFQVGSVEYGEIYDDSGVEVVAARVRGWDWESASVDVLTIPSQVTYAYEESGYDVEENPIWVSASKTLPVIEVSSLYCPAKKIVLPDSIREICGGAFANDYDLEEINIPNGVETIENGTFTGCTALKAIELPASVREIGDNAFGYCECLRTVTAHGKLDVIRFRGFAECSSLSSFNAEKGVSKIENNAFSYCWSLEAAPISDETRRIGEDAFTQCYALRTVNLPNSLEGMGRYAFNECTNLVSVQVGSEFVFDYAFNECPKLRTVTFSPSCTNIGQSAFRNCTDLRDVSFPDTLVNIEGSAFSGCGSLKSVVLPPFVTNVCSSVFADSGLTSITVRAECVTFCSCSIGCTNDEQLVVSGQDLMFSEYALDWIRSPALKIVGREVKFNKSLGEPRAGLFSVRSHSIVFEDNSFYGTDEFLKTLILNASRIYIGAYAFYDRFGLNDGEIIGDDVYIGDYAFEQSFLTQLPRFSEGLRHVGNHAFDARTFHGECSSGAPLSLPTTVTNIGDYAFAYANISSLQLPCDAAIGNGAFCCCQNLTSLDISGNVSFEKKDKWSGAFFCCQKLSRVSLTYEDVTQLNPSDNAFYACTNISDITVRSLSQLELFETESITPKEFVEYLGTYDQSKVKSISISGFTKDFCETELCGFTNIQQIAFTGGIETVASNGFANCSDLATVDFGSNETLTEIGENAFRGLTNFKAITLPSSLRHIGDNVFRDCESLSDVSVAPGVYDIGAGVFMGCSSLKQIELPTVMIIGTNAFAFCSALQSVAFSGCVVIGDNAFDSCTSLKEIDLSTVKTIMDKSFANCTSLKKLVIPSELEVFGDEAFVGCRYLEELKIEYRDVYDSCVSNLFGLVGAGCDVFPKKVELGFFPNGMSTGYIEELTVVEGTTAGSDRLYTPASANKVNLPASLVDVKKLAIGGPKYTVAEANTKYANDANGSLRSKDGREMLGWANVSERWYGGANSEVTFFLDYVTKIGDRAFQNCDKLRYLTLDSHVTTIGKEAFKGLPNLECVSFGNKVSSIGDGAFEDCPSLRIVNPFPKSLGTLGKRAFANCTAAGNYVFEGKPPKVTATNSTQYVFAGAPGFSQCQGEYFYKNYASWTNKLGKAGIGPWQGIYWFCAATNTVEYNFGNLSPTMRATCDRLLEERGFTANEDSTAELAEGTTEEDLVKSDLLGVEPTLEIAGDTAYFSTDAMFTIEDFQINTDAKTAALRIAITTENGQIPATFALSGIPDIQVKESLSDEWRDLCIGESFEVEDVGNQKAVMSVTVDLSDYKFFRAKVD